MIASYSCCLGPIARLCSVCHKGMDGLCATIVTEQKVECARQKEAGGTAIEEAMCRGKDLRPINDDR